MNRSLIDEVLITSDEIHPSIVSFPNGTLSHKYAPQFQCGYYYDKKKNVIGIANGRIVYKSCLSFMDKESTYSMLGIHNRRTNKIKLINTECWQVSPALDDQLNYNTHLNNDSTSLLNQQFGSKKIKRRAVQYGKMKINLAAVTNQLEITAKKAKIDQNDLSYRIPEQTMNHVPPCNRDAKSSQDIYNLEDIIPFEKLQVLNSQINASSINELERLPLFVDAQIALSSEPRRNEKIAMLEFMYGINRWLNMNVRDAKKESYKISKIPKISNFIVETYSILSTNGRTRPISIRDKAVIHSIILALMINNYQLDLEKFSKSFNLSYGKNKLLELAKVIGAVLSRENKNIIVLKVPLPPQFNTISFKKKKNN